MTVIIVLEPPMSSCDIYQYCSILRKIVVWLLRREDLQMEGF